MGAHSQSKPRGGAHRHHRSHAAHSPAAARTTSPKESSRRDSTARGASTKTRLLRTGAVLAATGLVSTAGTYATFTHSVNEAQSLASGTVLIQFVGAAGAATNRLTVAATGIVPGDTMQRAVDIQNNGTQDFASVALTTSATTTSLLDTDATNGLQMVIDKCSAVWTESGTSPSFTYTCGGTTSSVLATRAVIGSGLAMSNLSTITAGLTDHLRVTLTFPSVAGNTLQGLTSVVDYSFTATQRTGSAH